jgi:hypothetical protein
VKTSTILILAAAGVGVVYFVTRPKTSLPFGSSAATSSTNSLFGQLGALAGGFIVGSGGGGFSRPVSSGAGGGSGGGDNEVAIVRGLDSANIDAYDAQGDVYGIAGLDY